MAMKLAKSLARSLGSSFQRIQCTPDLLPSDITGISHFNQKTGEFAFRPGPILSQIVLADEINRATPRTQSALLEAMEECQISVERLDTILMYPPILPIERFGLPARHPFGEHAASHRLLEDPQRVVGIRDWALGAELCRVHWKATARAMTLPNVSSG